MPQNVFEHVRRLYPEPWVIGWNAYADIVQVEMPETGKRDAVPGIANVGFGAIVGAGTLLGLNGKTAHSDAQAAQVAATSVASQQQQQQDDAQRWRERMEQKLDALSEKVAHIEGRLEKR
jgi:hypothetical protein